MPRERSNQVVDEISAMWLAIELAKRGEPSPNPYVGAVALKDGAIIGRGYHQRAGADHAEIAAIKDAGEAIRGATIVVTLEPCNHHGRTGPCTDALIAAGVSKVVIGTRDPLPHAPGASEKLKAAGIEVELSPLGEPCAHLIRDFTKAITRGIPFITVKAAASLDGKMATEGGESKWITGPEARREGHRLRSLSDGILIGIGTALADDPELTTRLVEGPSPKRFILDRSLRLPLGSKLMKSASEVPVYLLHREDAPSERRQALEEAGARLIAYDGSLEGALRAIAEEDIVRLLVEGGPRLHRALFELGEVDELAAFIAPAILGGQGEMNFLPPLTIPSMREAIRLERVETRALGQDLLIRGSLQEHKERQKERALDGGEERDTLEERS